LPIMTPRPRIILLPPGCYLCGITFGLPASSKTSNNYLFSTGFVASSSSAAEQSDHLGITDASGWYY
jgi:hypothetical protein